MSPVEVLDVVQDLLPRRCKRWLALMLVAGFLLVPNAASHAVVWYADQRAQQILEVLVPEIGTSQSSGVAP